MPVPIFLTIALLVLARQELPKPAPASLSNDPRAPITKAAKDATARGDLTGARGHLEQALWFSPHDTDVLQALVTASDDPDMRALWLCRWIAAAANEKGQLPREIAKVAEAEPELVDVITARAAALDEVMREIKKVSKKRGDAGNQVLERYLRSIAMELLRDAPNQWGPVRSQLNALLEPDPRAHVPVVTALTKVIREAQASGDTSGAIRAARILRGLAAQAGFKDLKGPKAPDMSAAQATADDALARARAKLDREQGAPLTVSELLSMMPEEARAFTQEHQDFDRPGVAISPNGLYRIETICGYDTLLGAAETIELHHARLVDWFGRDPFDGRQGTVRIVPEATGLEAEGAGYWWVGGFQSGDITTMRFNASNIASLGHGLTHELTHRFDGAIFPGMPAWLVEGRAVYTGAAYGAASDPSFSPSHCQFGTMESAMRKGYGGLDNLKKLLAGTIDDYRDNYSAGYALFVYLNTWDPRGNAIFHDRLRAYMEGMATRKSPEKWFEASFCDGKAGRPKDLAAFAENFGTYLGDFYWQNRTQWALAYNRDRLSTEGSPVVYDAPTWGFRRNRAEPWFGEGQARLAGVLFAERRRNEEAAQAMVWSMSVDEWSTDHAELTASLFDALREKTAAWAIRQQNHLRRPRTVSAPGPCPLLRSMPITTRALATYQKAVLAAKSSGKSRTSAALAADHDRLAALFGEPPIAPTWDTTGEDARSPKDLLPPFAGPPHYAGYLGFVEDDLTGYEEYRVKNLWYDDGEGSLHVGRAKPRDATGQMDARAHQRDAYARTEYWIPAGRHRITTRIHFTTSYVSGAMIVGHTRRDRNLRLHFNAGDYMFSIGNTDSAATLNAVNVSLSGVRDGEGGTLNQAPGRRVKFDHPVTSFRLEVLIDGPVAVAYVEGEPIGAYHTADGQPIEGHLGFAAGFGAYRAERPTIAPLLRPLAVHAIEPDSRGLTLHADGPDDPRRLLNRPTEGLPLSPAGTIALLIPEPREEAGWEVEEGDDKFDRDFLISTAKRAAKNVSDLLWTRGFDLPLTIALPAMLTEEDRAKILSGLDEEAARRCSVIIHERRTPLSSDDKYVENKDEEDLSALPTLVYIDPIGVLRGMMSFRTTRELEGGIEPWMQVYRGRVPVDPALLEQLRAESFDDEDDLGER